MQTCDCRVLQGDLATEQTGEGVTKPRHCIICPSPLEMAAQEGFTILVKYKHVSLAQKPKALSLHLLEICPLQYGSISVATLGLFSFFREQCQLM